MDLTATSIFVAVLVSSVGLGILVYGKRNQRGPQLLVGFLLMAFPYLVSSPGWTLAIGAGLIAALWLLVRLGL